MFYLEQLNNNNIKFLENKYEEKAYLEKQLLSLIESTTIHHKIEVAKDIWKFLVKHSLSYMDQDKRGYDKLFDYFDDFVKFEELIFASDSFYRDHTLHCLWVYFLTEYLYKRNEFDVLFMALRFQEDFYPAMLNLFKTIDEPEIFEYVINIFENLIVSNEYQDSVRCVAALTHDLGYPLTKITKINKAIGKILPYFSLTKFNVFDFHYESIQQIWIQQFLETISFSYTFNLSADYSAPNMTENVKNCIDFLNQCVLMIIETQEQPYETISEVKGLISTLTDLEKETLKKVYEFPNEMKKDVHRFLRYSRDFESYTHGIMSAYLLMKTVAFFEKMQISYSDLKNVSIETTDLAKLSSKLFILQAMSDHTSPGFKIQSIENLSSLLTFVDEIEEFSRISRVDQNRQYANEFCRTELFFEDDCLHVHFIFDNKDIPNLNPELSFKGKCKKLLHLFDIDNLAPSLKLVFLTIDRLQEYEKVYELKIAQKVAKITINNELKIISQYLETNEF